VQSLADGIAKLRTLMAIVNSADGVEPVEIRFRATLNNTES
jgi:hypothetical protein